MTEEEYCLQTITELQRMFEKSAQPYIDRIIEIRRLSISPKPIFIHMTEDQAKVIGMKIEAMK